MKRTKKRAVTRKPASGTRSGREILSALAELADAIESGESLSARFTIRTVELPDEPHPYDAHRVRAVRAKVGASQTVFARLLGVSSVLVQHWENGSRIPAPWARRLLDEVNRDPEHWRSMLRGKRDSGSAA